MKFISGLIGLSLICSLSLATDDSLKVENINPIHVHRFGACNWWTYAQSNTGSIYACSSYPFTVTVPDANDVARALENAEKRITALETKIGILESKLEKSE